MYFPDRCNELVIAFNTDSEDEMLYYILYKNSEKYAQKYEMRHRDELKSKWNFNLKYDGRKHWFEITVQLLNKIYSLKQLKSLIEEYTDSMNYWL